VLLALGLALGKQWWNTEARDYDTYTYKPLALSATAKDGRLTLTLRDPGWLPARRLDDLLPDHGHLMHLFVIGVPEMDRLWHLHPTAVDPERYVQPLAAMPAGRYQLFADVVHATGLPETLVAELELGATDGNPLTGDDAAGEAAPISRADFARSEAPLDDGARMVWQREAGPIRAGRATWFRFRVEDAAGRPTGDLEPYMGMMGHAAFVRHDRSVFAHVHPSGSVPMAALALTGIDPHAAHATADSPSEVAFPYGLPRAGAYRLFVQIKRRGHVQTAAFDLRAD
jgi:hypothetical protein